MSQDQSTQEPKKSPDPEKPSGAEETHKTEKRKNGHHPVHYSKERDELPLEDEIRLENLENEGGPPLD